MPKSAVWALNGINEKRLGFVFLLSGIPAVDAFHGGPTRYSRACTHALEFLCPLALWARRTAGTRCCYWASSSRRTGHFSPGILFSFFPSSGSGGLWPEGLTRVLPEGPRFDCTERVHSFLDTNGPRFWSGRRTSDTTGMSVGSATCAARM